MYPTSLTLTFKMGYKYESVWKEKIKKQFLVVEARCEEVVYAFKRSIIHKKDKGYRLSFFLFVPTDKIETVY